MVSKNRRRKRIKKGNKLGTLVLILIGASFGILTVIISGRFFPQGIIRGNNFFTGLIDTYIFLAITILGYLLHIIIHEGGHLIFGLLTGYKFVSFRVGSLTLIKEEGRFKLKKFNIPGTAGQCLMMPPDMVDGNFPFVIYNLGGVLLNLIISIISLYLGIKLEGPDLLRAILIFSSIGGIFAALSNGIPLGIGGIANDGHNIVSMLINKETRKAFHIQLKVHGLQSQGRRIKDMPIEDFPVHEDADLAEPFNTAMILLRHNYYMDRLDFSGARDSLNLLLPYMDQIVALYQNEINIERIFLELMEDGDRDLVTRLYSKNLKKYIKASKFMIGKKRFMMAYEGLYNKDLDKARSYYRDLEKMIDTYPNKAEAEMELMLAKAVRDKMEKKF